jgi:hypothetical protein
MDLGHVGIYRGLARAAALSGEAEQQLFDALQRKAVDEVDELTEALPDDLRRMLRALSELCGGREVLDLAQACLVDAPDDVHAALDDLMAIADALSLRYPELPLYFDLGELRGYHYHTGVVFAVKCSSACLLKTQYRRVPSGRREFRRRLLPSVGGASMNPFLRNPACMDLVWPAAVASLQPAIIRRNGSEPVDCSVTGLFCCPSFFRARS